MKIIPSKTINKCNGLSYESKLFGIYTDKHFIDIQ